jgi:hypothetical protein
MALFRLGQVVSTPAALEVCEAAGISPWELIRKHAYGDFGLVDKEDVQANQDAIAYEDRIVSKYKVEKEYLYVITERDRSVTTVMLCSEY